MLTMTVTEAKNHFDKLIDMAQHEPVTIMGLNKPLVVVTATQQPKLIAKTPRSLFGSMKGTFGSKEQIDANLRSERDKWDD